MTIALSLLFVCILLALLFIAAMQPNPAIHSAFERKRRRDSGGDTKLNDLREKRFADATTVLRIILALLLTAMVLSAIWLFGLGGGIIVSVIVIITYGFLARMVPLKRFAQNLYNEQEYRLLEFTQRHKAVFKWLRHDVYVATSPRFESKEELAHLIHTDRTVLSSNEKQLLAGALAFDSRTVKDLMTPKEKTFSIKKTEILGPLVLDDLHKSGHDSFPVTNGEGTENIVGILRLRDVQTLDTTRKHTARVETAMDPDVRTIGANEPISAALQILLDSQHHVLIVTNDDQSIAGLLTLKDIIKTLFGR